MPDQSAIPMFDNSRNKLLYSTSTTFYGKNVNVVEWDSVTSAPHKIVGTLIRASNAVHEIEGKVTSTMKESDIAYNSGSSDKDKLYMRGIVEEPEESDSTSSSKYDEVNNGFLHDEMNNNEKTPTKNCMTKHNSSACHFLSPNSTITVTLESVISASSTANDTFKKIQDEFVSDLRIINIVEIFNSLAMFIASSFSSEVSSTTHHSSSSENSTFRSAKDEFFDEVDAKSVTHFTGKTLDRNFLQIYGSEGEAEISLVKGREEHPNDKHSGDNINIDDYAVVKSKQDHENFEKNSKLNPQVILRSKFEKNDINEQENEIINDSDVDHIVTSKEDSKQGKSSDCATPDEKKFWKLRDDVREKYNEDEKDNKSSPVLAYFEKTLWEKLVAGLKCSQRDCREALKPTESVRRYLIEPSISRARKHSNGKL